MRLIHRSLLRRDCADRALVLHAMDIDYVLERGLVGWRVLVPEHEEARALEQIRLYEFENQPRPPQTFAEARPGALAAIAGWTLTLLAAYALQSNYAFGINWLEAGRSDVAAVRAGEWWRVITALTLHADVGHLYGNVGFGAAFCALLARQIGVGMAWLMVLLGGAAGNLMNVALQPSWHTSIGASTSVFAALGLLAAYLWTARRLIHDSWARRWTPIVGAIVLLAWLGTGDENTDVVAHLTGFVGGFGIGAALGRFATLDEADPLRQIVFGALTAGILAAAWAAAVA
jgi:membrane associated rhomboid family serine protease